MRRLLGPNHPVAVPSSPRTVRHRTAAWLGVIVAALSVGSPTPSFAQTQPFQLDQPSSAEDDSSRPPSGTSDTGDADDAPGFEPFANTEDGDGDREGEDAHSTFARPEGGSPRAADIEEQAAGEPLPEPRYGTAGLPRAVEALRERLLEAARSGDVVAVARLVEPGADGTQLSLVDDDRPAAERLREQSGDDEGHEILAILSEVLEAGHVVIDEGTEQALYLWPYFAALPLDALTDAQRVEMFRILTAADLQAMEEFGTYVFYRVGIDADGRWRFFVSGD